MANDYGRWIEWDGKSKKSPIPPDTRYQVKFRNGTTSYEDQPDVLVWKHERPASPSDIIAYCLYRRHG